MEFSDGRYKWDASDMDIAYKMAEEELGFKPNYVNRGNIKKEFLKAVLFRTNKDLENVGNALYDVYVGNTNMSKDKLGDILQTTDKYGFYTKEGKKFAEKLYGSGFLNRENLRDLYFNKYQPLWENK